MNLTLKIKKRNICPLVVGNLAPSKCTHVRHVEFKPKLTKYAVITLEIIHIVTSKCYSDIKNGCVAHSLKN